MQFTSSLTRLAAFAFFLLSFSMLVCAAPAPVSDGLVVRDDSLVARTDSPGTQCKTVLLALKVDVDAWVSTYPACTKDPKCDYKGSLAAIIVKINAAVVKLTAIIKAAIAAGIKIDIQVCISVWIDILVSIFVCLTLCVNLTIAICADLVICLTAYVKVILDVCVSLGIDLLVKAQIKAALLLKISLSLTAVLNILLGLGLKPVLSLCGLV